MNKNSLMELGKFNGVRIAARPTDRYINATQMCKATGKRWASYFENQSTKDFLAALSLEVGIPTSNLIVTRRGKPSHLQGTWVHLDVAIHLAQWCSPEFAVWVSRQIRSLFESGHVLVPREHSEAILHRAVGDIGTALVGIVEIQKEHGSKIDRIEGLAIETHKIATETKRDVEEIKDRDAKRAPITEATKQRHIECIHNYFGGVCPCCNETMIVDCIGTKIPDVCEFDHFYFRSKGSVTMTWPVCKKCNQNLRDPGFHDSKTTLFKAYQQRREAYEKRRQPVFEFYRT